MSPDETPTPPVAEPSPDQPDATAEERQATFTRRALLLAGWTAPVILTAALPGSAYAQSSFSDTPFTDFADTIPIRPGAPDNLRVLSCAELLTDSIRRIFTDDSVSEVFGGENQLF